jgi:hypothetical protein
MPHHRTRPSRGRTDSGVGRELKKRTQVQVLEYVDVPDFVIRHEARGPRIKPPNLFPLIIVDQDMSASNLVGPVSKDTDWNHRFSEARKKLLRYNGIGYYRRHCRATPSPG